MRSIKVLLEAEKNGEDLTVDEQKYLERYKKAKNVRHSTGFVYHSRRLPNEDEARSEDRD